MKKIILLALLCAFFSVDIFSNTESIFHYDSEALNNEFSELIQIENLVSDQFLSLDELLVTNVSVSNFLKQQDDVCVVGTNDARIQYSGSNALWGSLCCTGGTNPIFGLILVLVVRNDVKQKNLNLNLASPNINNAEYLQCYRTEAIDIKRAKLWTGFGIGTGIYAIAVIYLAAVGI